MNVLSYFKRKPKIIVVCGPTATGKTSLSVKIAQGYNGEVISADSRQVYRGMDIGTAKVTPKEMQSVPHHMIDVADPTHRYSVQEFASEAREKISEIISRGHVPIICGGTGQYIDALVFNQSFPMVPPNKTLRKKLEKLSTKELFNSLQQQDPRRAKNIDHHNKVRLIRALEIIDAVGVVPRQRVSSPYRVLFVGLDLENELLHQRIVKRINERFEYEGMLDEARRLYSHGLSYERMEELGLEYRYMARHLQGKISYEEMVEQLTIATRQFVKRQRTWFKRNPKIHWFDPARDQDKIHAVVKNFLK